MTTPQISRPDAPADGHPRAKPGRPVVYAMTGACGLCGGIAAANRNVLQALADLAGEHGRPLHVLSLLERPADRPPLGGHFDFRAFAGDKRRFAGALLRLAPRRPLYCFDHVTLALPVLPLAAAGLARTVLFAHGSEASTRSRLTSRWSFRCAALTLTNSEFTLRKMRQFVPRFRGEACPLGLAPEFDADEAPPKAGGPADEPIELESVDGVRRPLGDRALLLVARLDPREGEKGHAELIDALPRLLRDFPDAQLVFPGPGDGRRTLEDQARRLGVAHAVFLPGWVPTDLLKRLYRRCFAFAMPSRQEGFGMVYLEAMSHRKPCIGCLDDGAETVIAPGETGWLVSDPSDPAELCDVLRAALADPDRARTFGENGYRRLREQFSAEAYRRRLREKLVPLFRNERPAAGKPRLADSP